MKPVIIVLFGVKSSGKSTAGREIANTLGFAEDSFAAPIKNMVRQAFNFDDDALYGASSQRERQFPQYPFTGPCLSCGNPSFAFEFDTAMCRGCSATYPRHLNARIACQTLGTEWGRRLYSNVWVDAAFSRIQRRIELGGPERVVITDGRFENEVLRCRELGAYCVLLTRDPNPVVKKSWWKRGTTHPSEKALEIPRGMFHEIFDNAKSDVHEARRAIIPVAQNAIRHAQINP